MASRKEYEMLFALQAQVDSSFDKTFKSGQSAIVSMQKEIDALNKVQANISAYEKQQGAIETTQKKLQTLQQQYDNIQKEMAETGTFSAKLENQLLTKQQQIDKTTVSLDAQTSKLNTMGNALREAGVNTDNLAKENAQLGSKIDEMKHKQEEAAGAAGTFGESAAQAFGLIHQAIITAGIAVALKEIYDYFMSCADASVEFESAMTGVAKTTELTDQEFAAMSESVKGLSTEIPATTTELAAIAETAGQLGIAKDSLLDFTEIMAMLGTATNMTADEAATMLAQFASITGMDPAFYMNLGSAIVALGNSYATTERNIADMSQTIAAAGSIAGMSEADIVAISAAVTSLGITAQNGGTQMTKLISDINSAVSSGKNLDKWARAAGRSADDFARAWGEDAASGLDAFIQGLNGAYESGQDVYGILEDIGITETRMVTMITSLAKSGDRLNATLQTSNQAWDESAALTTEAAKRYATTRSELILMQNEYNRLRVAVGDAFTPALRELYELEGQVFGELAEFVEMHPELVQAGAAFIGVLGTASVGLAAYAARVKIATALTKAFTAAAGVPMLGPITAAVVGVAALTAGIVALNAVYNESRKELEEYEEANEALIRSYEEMTALHKDAGAKYDIEQQNAMALIGKLAELTSTTDGAKQNQQAILAIIDSLNQSVPELALSYDQVANASGGFIESLYDIAKARAAQLTLEEKWKEYVDRVGQQDALKAARDTAQANIEAARQEMELASRAYAESQTGLWELSQAMDKYKTYNEVLTETAAAYDENAAALAELEAAFKEYQAKQEAAEAGTGDLRDVMREVNKEVKELEVEYIAAYDAAVESVSGQYSLWDKAAKVVATSSDAINSALESQIAYWQGYDENLGKLIERSGNIEGLSDLIATFADGSKDSVNAIAGMARASDVDLAKMVKNWQALQEEQKTVAGSLAELETDFAVTMNALQTDLEDAIAGMNFNEEAAKSGQETIQGYIDAATAMTPEVREAYAEVAAAAIEAINERLQIHSPSEVMWDIGEMTWQGYIDATKAMQSQVADVMAATTGAAIGTNVTTVSAVHSGGGGGGVVLSLDYSPRYEINGTSNPGEIQAILQDHDNNLRDIIIRTLEDYREDNQRRAFA